MVSKILPQNLTTEFLGFKTKKIVSFYRFFFVFQVLNGNLVVAKIHVYESDLRRMFISLHELTILIVFYMIFNPFKTLNGLLSQVAIYKYVAAWCTHFASAVL